MAESAQAVTFTIVVNGTEEAVTSFQAVADEVETTAARVAGSYETMTAAAEASTAAIQDGNDVAAASASDAADVVLASNEKVVASNATVSSSIVDLAAQYKATVGEIGASSASLSAAGAGASTSLMGVLGSMRTLATGLAVYGGLKAFADYQTALTKLSTLAGITQNQLGGLNTAFRAMAVPLGTSPTALAQAAYNPASEGFGPAGTQQVVRYAAELANIGGAPLAGQDGTSYAISTMLQLQGQKPTQQNVAQMAAFLRGATSSGDMTLQQLISAQQTGIFSAGKTYGIPEGDMAGALAFFSSQGVQPNEAASRLRMGLSLLVGNSAQAAKYSTALGLNADWGQSSGLSAQLQGLGLAPTKFADMLNSGPGGLVQVFDTLNKAMASLPHDQQVALWAKLFGGGRSDTTAMTLAQGAANGELQNFTSMVSQNSTVAGFNQANRQTQGTLAFQFKQLKAELDLLAISVGQKLVPVVKLLNDVLGPVVTVLTKVPGAMTLFTAAITLMLARTAMSVSGAALGSLGRLGAASGIGTGIGDLLNVGAIRSGDREAESGLGQFLSGETRLSVGMGLMVQRGRSLAATMSSVVRSGFANAAGGAMNLAGALTGTLRDGAATAAEGIGSVASKAATFGGLMAGRVMSGIRSVGTALGILTPAEEAATGGMVEFDAAADANPVGAIVLAVTALIAGLVLLITHWEQVANFLHSGWGQAVTAALVVFMPFIGLPLEAYEHWRGLWQIIEEGAHDIAAPFEYLYHLIENLVSAMEKAGSWLEHSPVGKAIGWASNVVGFAAGGQVGGMYLANSGGMGGVDRPTAIVGEGNPRYPETVIPSDPSYRARAIGLWQQAGTKLFAAGGTTDGGSGSGTALVGSGTGLLNVLGQLATGNATGVLRSLLGGISSTAASGLAQANRTVDQAIATAVPGGMFRSLMLGMTDQVMTLAQRAVAGGTASSQTAATTAATGTVGPVGSIANPTDFAKALLGALGDPQTAANIASIVDWENREGGNWHNTAHYNPINTTLPEPGSTSMNSDHVQAYTSWQQGVQATVATLRNGKYPDLLAAFAAGTGLANHPYSELSTWSGGGYSELAAGGIVGQTGPAPSLPVLKFDQGGLLPVGASISLNETGKPEPVGHDLVKAGGGYSGPDTIKVAVMVDKKQIGEATIDHLRSRYARS